MPLILLVYINLFNVLTHAFLLDFVCYAQFSRGTLLELSPLSHYQFFISGTASVVGSESVHIDNVQAQLHETMENIRVLMSQANISKYVAGHIGFEFSDLTSVRVYIKHSHDYPIIRSLLSSYLPHCSNILYLRTDICRDNLLLEIEGIAEKRFK